MRLKNKKPPDFVRRFFYAHELISLSREAARVAAWISKETISKPSKNEAPDVIRGFFYAVTSALSRVEMSDNTSYDIFIFNMNFL